MTYILHFAAMKFFLNSSGNVSKTIQPTINMARLEDFYNVHKMYEKFILPLPGKGNLTVRFAKPLEYKIKENGNGLVDAFQLEVLTQP